MSLEKSVKFPYINESEDYIELIASRLDELTQSGEISIFEAQDLRNIAMSRFFRGYFWIIIRSIYGISLGLLGILLGLLSYIVPQRINILYIFYKWALPKPVQYEIFIVEQLYLAELISNEQKEERIAFYKKAYYDSIVPIYNIVEDGELPA